MSGERTKISGMSLVVICFLLTSKLTITFSAAGEQENDRITVLPGQPELPVPFSQFSGYVTVNEEHGRALFYWLTEAQAPNPQEKPLVLWLSGGPGCSSIGFGASEEIGPFGVGENGSSLHINKYSWNKEANIIFLESPAGVGFSYTNKSSDLKDPGDKRTAMDALIFLIRCMSRFPQYKDRDFYLAGESYAGHYVPQLANEIHEHNKDHPNESINLKGFIVGNGLIDTKYDSIGKVNYWWSHSIISDTTYKRIMSFCTFKTLNYSKNCKNAISYAYDHEFGEIDPYSIYTPFCTENTVVRRRLSEYDPCTKHGSRKRDAQKYFNRPDVQHAMHANTTGIPYAWNHCSDVISDNWKDSQFSMLPTYKKLMAAGYRIWVYSGDTDSVVPVTATRFSLRQLNLAVKTQWYPWYVDGQVGGWTEVYDGLTFASVRGAGHEVPKVQPERAFVLFQSFLAGKNLPRS